MKNTAVRLGLGRGMGGRETGDDGNSYEDIKSLEVLPFVVTAPL